jgi:PPOX class probable F420-dependent enzyme
LACSTKHGVPLNVPICFAFDGSTIYSAIDEKPKKAAPLALRRVSNIQENANVCLTVDKYSEDWRKLQYVLVFGRAKINQQAKKFPEAIALLRNKYHQYNSMKLETRPLITIRPLRIVAWKPSTAPGTVKPKEYEWS